EMTQLEWQIAMQLREVLQIFKDATLFFSRSTPSLATVIPAMDHIDETLATRATNANPEEQIEPSIIAAILIGKKTLNRYYNKTDDSEVYRIAMILHPRHKLEYFRKAGWEPAWIAAA
ncbi:hypothetical protein BD779DRAFT_1420400, partial [Infundibulicybe gibba]